MKVINNKYCVDYELCYQEAYKTLIFDGELFYDLVVEQELEVERYYKKAKKKTKTTTFWQAISIFKDELPEIVRLKKGYEHSNDPIWDKLLPKKNIIDKARAKSVPVDLVLNHLGISHCGGRCKTPFVDNATNNTAFQFRDNKYICHRTGKKGDTINLVMELMNRTFIEAVNFLNDL